MAYGGLYGMLPIYTMMAELAERIEVLKGPSAMLNGMPPAGFDRRHGQRRAQARAGRRPDAG